jgi:hypothetical protein
MKWGKWGTQGVFSGDTGRRTGNCIASFGNARHREQAAYTTLLPKRNLPSIMDFVTHRVSHFGFREERAGESKCRPRRGLRRSILAGYCLAVTWALTSVACGGTLIFSVVDGSGASVPCRIFLKDAKGKPVQPRGLPFWRDHFCCLGSANVDVPPGAYTYEVEHGPEFRPAAGAVTVPAKGRGRVAAVLRRLANLPAEGWFAGDLHIHRPPAEMPVLVLSGDIQIAPVITWWNRRSRRENAPQIGQPAGQGEIRVGKDHFYDVLAGEDEREGGALLYFGLKEPLPLGHATNEYPSTLYFATLARGQAGAWVDIEKPFWWDVPMWLASGKVDSIELANNHMNRAQMRENEAWGKPRDVHRLPPPKGNGYWSQEIYYQILNAGLRIPPTAGSASGVLPNPVGYNRVYAQVGGELTPARWWEAVKAGRTFVTNGPLLRVQADGQWPGHIFSAGNGNRVSVRLSVRFTSNDPVRAVEVVKNGEVVRTIPVTWNAETGEAVVSGADAGTVDFDASGWFLLRTIVENPVTFRFASTAPFYVEIGATPRRISRQSVTFFRDWVDERIARIKKTVTDARQRAEILRDHEAARTYWEKRLSEANAP